MSFTGDQVLNFCLNPIRMQDSYGYVGPYRQIVEDDVSVIVADWKRCAVGGLGSKACRHGAATFVVNDQQREHSAAYWHALFVPNTDLGCNRLR